jgi:L-lactate dehydrogenase complex protein LldF
LCIRCGACLNVCPVYRETGGHAYGWVYPGPIGAVISPLHQGFDKYGDLPYASTLCGACLEACPMEIDLPAMLLELRRDQVEKRRSASRLEGLAFRAYALISRSPTLYRLGARVGALAQLPFVRKDWISYAPPPVAAWTRGRDFPAVSTRPFHTRAAELGLKGRAPESTNSEGPKRE